jgi:hypothetical protein
VNHADHLVLTYLLSNTEVGSIAMAVAVRSRWPAMHPSLKNFPSDIIAITASFLAAEVIVSLTRPR